MRHIVALVGCDRQSRRALTQLVRWQQALEARVHVLRVAGSPAAPDSPLDLDRFHAWMNHTAQLGRMQLRVSSCSIQELPQALPKAIGDETDLLLLPGSPDLSAVAATLPVHVAWSRVAALGGKILLGRGEPVLRRAMVVSDGTPRTLSVLQAAFDIAELFDAHLSHVDTRVVLPSWRQEPRASSWTPAGDCEQPAARYLTALHAIIDTVKRAPRSQRPDLVLVGAPATESDATVSALAAALLPCSLMVVPL